MTARHRLERRPEDAKPRVFKERGVWRSECCTHHHIHVYKRHVPWELALQLAVQYFAAQHPARVDGPL